jgi:hypothetical protein
LSNAKQRFQGMADFAPRAIRIAFLTHGGSCFSASSAW